MDLSFSSCLISPISCFWDSTVCSYIYIYIIMTETTISRNWRRGKASWRLSNLMQCCAPLFLRSPLRRLLANSFGVHGPSISNTLNLPGTCTSRSLLPFVSPHLFCSLIRWVTELQRRCRCVFFCAKSLFPFISMAKCWERPNKKKGSLRIGFLTSLLCERKSNVCWFANHHVCCSSCSGSCCTVLLAFVTSTACACGSRSSHSLVLVVLVVVLLFLLLFLRLLLVLVFGNRLHRRRETFFKNDMLSCGWCCCVEDDDYRDYTNMMYSMDIAIISSTFLSYEHSTNMGWGGV